MERLLRKAWACTWQWQFDVHWKRHTWHLELKVPHWIGLPVRFAGWYSLLIGFMTVLLYISLSIRKDGLINEASWLIRGIFDLVLATLLLGGRKLTEEERVAREELP